MFENVQRDGNVYFVRFRSDKSFHCVIIKKGPAIRRTCKGNCDLENRRGKFDDLEKVQGEILPN